MRRTARSTLLIGLMSGTSADGIDVALVRIAGRSEFPRAQVENFLAVPYPTPIRQAVLRVANGAATTSREISQLNFRIGKLFAEAALRACHKFRVSPKRVALIGSHGQTIFHQGTPGPFIGTRVASTLQIGEPSVIAAFTGITTVGDFRPADIAAGGQGAPLVPYVDFLLYRHPRRSRIALNVGGIANVTAIPAGAALSDLTAFDTGPGNMIIDALATHFTHGRQRFDRDSRLALRGRLLPELLQKLLAHPYFRAKPPKTAGREEFGAPLTAQLLAWRKKNRARPFDLIHTATAFTAASIAGAICRFVLPRGNFSELIASGGGARNPLLLAYLSALLPSLQLIPAGALGIPGDAKEAFAFAILAYQTWHHRSDNVPSATGARQPAILGKVCYAPPR